MKNTLKLLLSALLLSFLAASCNDDNNNNDDGVITLTNAGGYYFGLLNDDAIAANIELWFGNGTVTEDDFRLTGNGTGLYFQIYLPDNNSASLTPGAYRAARYSDNPAEHTFIIGNSISDEISYMYMKEEGQTAQMLPITDGTLYITQEGSAYTALASITVSGGVKYEMKFSGTIGLVDEREPVDPGEPELPEYQELSYASAAYYGQTTQSGVDNFVLYLLSAGVDNNGVIYADQGTVLILDLYGPASGNPVIQAGTYQPYTASRGYEYSFLPGDENTGTGSSVREYIDESVMDDSYIIGGKVVIEETDGTYYITADIITNQNVELHYSYRGDIDVTDER